jgi:DNA (cytosine-5)-methyltransferase 1
MFDRGFEEEGWCVVRGPDVLWGGDIRDFHPPAGVFDGVIGGPPCQAFSPIGNVNRARWGDDSVMPDLIPEFCRIVENTEPTWWVMENSPYAHGPRVANQDAYRFVLENAQLGERQRRKRAFWTNLLLHVKVPALVPVDAGSERTVSSKGAVDWKGSRARETKRSLADCLDLQGFPRDWMDRQPWTMQAKRKMVGNGVPLPMSRAIARAVVRALESRDAGATG